jgi:hypothetical protein
VDKNTLGNPWVKWYTDCISRFLYCGLQNTLARVSATGLPPSANRHLAVEAIPSGHLVSGVGILAVCWMAAAVICSAGCALGLGVGWRVSQLLAERADLPFVFDSRNAWLTTAFSAAMNFAFALLPATRAARVSPLRALKYE